MMSRLLSRVGIARSSCNILNRSYTSAKGIYLDFQATTPVDPRVLDAMLPYQVENYGNPHSVTHEFGTDAAESVELARHYVANLVNANSSKEIIFTSGATESNNLALKGMSDRLLENGKNHIIVSQIEHKCILQTAKDLEKRKGMEVTFLPVQNNGLVDLDELRDCITDRTGLVSVMYVNNEVGVVQPIKDIGSICQENDIIFHTDAAQALGKVNIDVLDENIDLMSMSSHKLYGPKGIGGLYVKRKRPRIGLKAEISGGGQERGFRSGTLPTFLCVGFGEACRVAELERERDDAHLTKLRNLLLEGIRSQIDEVYVNGDLESRYAGNLNLSFAYVEGESLMLELDDEVYVSSGSACTSVTLEPSYVLMAMSIDDSLAHTSIRFGMGRFTTDREIEYAVDKIVKGVERLRELSPLYYMAQKGIDISEIQWDEDHHH